jgi:broad specificity phosphatase PhoE
MTPLEKKQMRKARASIRKHDVKIEGVIRSSASSPIAVAQRPLDIDHLYHRAVKDMGIRVLLTDMHRAGNIQAGRRRRQLNDWELATEPAGPVDAWQQDSNHQPKGNRRAVGKCDVQGVTQLNQAKRGY